MSKGYSIHIGVNEVSMPRFEGWKGSLYAAEADAIAMQELAKSLHYENDGVILTENATYDRVMQEIDFAQKYLESGDQLLFTFSGHGAQFRDLNGDEQDSEPIQYDEAIVLYDDVLVDDELYAHWRKFDPGVKIVMICDSCYSGTISQRRFVPWMKLAGDETESPSFEWPHHPKFLPRYIAELVFAKNYLHFEAIQKSFPKGDQVDVEGPSIISLSACRDNEIAEEGDLYGIFTGYLLDVWATRTRGMTYDELHSKIVAAVSGDGFKQVPAINWPRTGTSRPPNQDKALVLN